MEFTIQQPILRTIGPFNSRTAFTMEFIIKEPFLSTIGSFNSRTVFIMELALFIVPSEGTFAVYCYSVCFHRGRLS